MTCTWALITRLSPTVNPSMTCAAGPAGPAAAIGTRRHRQQAQQQKRQTQPQAAGSRRLQAQALGSCSDGSASSRTPKQHRGRQQRLQWRLQGQRHARSSHPAAQTMKVPVRTPSSTPPPPTVQALHPDQHQHQQKTQQHVLSTHLGQLHELLPAPVVLLLAEAVQRVAVLGLARILVHHRNGELQGNNARE